MTYLPGNETDSRLTHGAPTRKQALNEGKAELSRITMNFTIDQLLLNGWVRCLGQLSRDQKAELDRRAHAGQLLKERIKYGKVWREVWRKPGVKAP